jgi:prepilin-type N-terminal cleavage/methylation domain-containing protein
MKKGFTLIELLAVIVILAIIATIATPIVLDIINDTRESAMMRNRDFYLDGVEYAISKRILNGKKVNDGTYSILDDGNICIGTYRNNICEGDILEVSLKGKKPNGDKITIQDGKIVSHVIKYGEDVLLHGDVEVDGDGQEFHKYAPTTLTFRSPTPLKEFKELKINGETIDKSNYTLRKGSTVITLSIDSIRILSAFISL